MITTAVLGRPPAAATWASNEDERRKALLSHLRVGAAAIVWDNIPRGALIKCPHLERALTSAEYTDRVLGVSEQLTVPSLTVMLFTGNNIAPCGDMASRSLVCSLDVSRPDPENRPFEHADPIAWTLANRMRFMRALYTFLMWNPYLRLSPADRVEPRTRFKTWWSSVGAVIEAVTCLIGEAPVDFTALFAANEVDDEEADGVAVICGAIEAKFGIQVFAVKEFCSLLEAGSASDVYGDAAEQAANAVATALREALQSIHDVPLTSWAFTPSPSRPNPQQGRQSSCSPRRQGRPPAIGP